jgi:hypothetical protein
MDDNPTVEIEIQGVSDWDLRLFHRGAILGTGPTGTTLVGLSCNEVLMSVGK